MVAFLSSWRNLSARGVADCWNPNAGPSARVVPTVGRMLPFTRSAGEGTGGRTWAQAPRARTGTHKDTRTKGHRHHVRRTSTGAGSTLICRCTSSTHIHEGCMPCPYSLQLDLPPHVHHSTCISALASPIWPSRHCTRPATMHASRCGPMGAREMLTTGGILTLTLTQTLKLQNAKCKSNPNPNHRWDREVFRDSQV